MKLITKEEDGARNGATIMVNGAQVTKGGAAKSRVPVFGIFDPADYSLPNN